jgi:hypothetical protein
MHLTRRGRIAVVLTLVLASLTVAGVYAYQRFVGLVLLERCTVRTATGEKTSVTPEQAANAATIAGVAVRRKLPERAAVIGIATAMQESKLRNLAGGDRDSIGLFQQRPSQGWGRPSQIGDPVYAVGRFYDALVEVPGYQTLPLTEAAQRVQRSGHPTAYAKHEPAAKVLAAALTGRQPTGLTCALRADDYSNQAMGSSGLTARGDQTRRELTRTFGKLSYGGFQPGGVHSGHIAGSAHYEGRALDVSFTPVNAANRRRGWAVAQWAVSHADRLGITEVIYDGRIWTARRSGRGWRTYQPPGGETGNATLMHRDHVHLTVARGA